MPKYNEEDCTGCMLFLLNLEVRDVNQSYNEKWNVLVPNNEYDQNIVVFDSIHTVPMKNCSKISYLKKKHFQKNEKCFKFQWPKHITIDTVRYINPQTII